MATFLDIGLLEYFLPLFSFILILVLSYAVLQKTKILGGKGWIDVTVAVIVSLVAMFSGSVFDFTNVAVPWFIILIVAVVMFGLVASFSFGSDISDIPIFRSLALWLPLIIIIWSIAVVFGPVFTPYSPGANSEWEALRTLFHPRVIGAIVMILVVLFTTKVVVQNT